MAKLLAGSQTDNNRFRLKIGYCEGVSAGWRWANVTQLSETEANGYLTLAVVALWSWIYDPAALRHWHRPPNTASTQRTNHRQTPCDSEMDKEEADQLIEKAKLCLRSGRKDRALQLLYEAQNIYPSTRARGKISWRTFCKGNVTIWHEVNRVTCHRLLTAANTLSYFRGLHWWLFLDRRCKN